MPSPFIYLIPEKYRCVPLYRLKSALLLTEGGFFIGKKSNLIHAMKNELQKEVKYGRSKHEDKKLARASHKHIRGIYATSTYKSYSKSCTHFIQYCLQEHGRDIKSIHDCREYVDDYLKDNENRNLSAWTIHARASALASMYHCSKDDFHYRCPIRSRANITRSRNIRSDTINNSHYQKIRLFCEVTGARRGGLIHLTVNDLRERKEGGIEIHLKEKNGMDRWARVLPRGEEYVKNIFNHAAGVSVNGENRLFSKSAIPKNCELHSCRSQYATEMYDLYLKEGYSTGKLYHCRSDKLGLSYDKGILLKVSEELGHHRCDVVISHYLYR